MNQWHSLNKEKVMESFSVGAEGLSREEAAAGLEKYGKNELQKARKKSLLQKFFAQFKDVMIIVLIVAALISAVIAVARKEYGELVDSGIILLIVILNAVIGLVQENKAEAALDALQNMNKPFSKVVRGGDVVQIRSEEIVPGDIVNLEAGDIVPADLRLISCSSLKIEEAALTGESVPAEKDADAVIGEDAPLGDRSNMAYSGGVVTYGRGQGVTVATGMNTEVGKIAKMLGAAEQQITPLQKQLAKTAKILSIAVLAVAAVIFAVSVIRKTEIVEAFMTAVAIAVAAIPEGLPAVVTIVLALGVQKMSKRNAIIKNLPAVETLGCCEVICSDKTGTLTLNKMTVKAMYTLSSGVLSAGDTSLEGDTGLAVKAMVLCNDTVKTAEGELIGDPTETALVEFYESLGGDYRLLTSAAVRTDEIPFDSVRKTMSTVNMENGVLTGYIKGATDVLLNKCAYISDNGTVRKIEQADKDAVRKATKAMADKALRVLGIAVKHDNLDKNDLENDMIFVGAVGMIDPPRPEVKEAVRVCKQAGMRPVMITGDHIDTAKAIAAEIGILGQDDKVMTGAEIDRVPDDEFAAIIHEYAVFARVSPENKVKIVKAFKANAKTVAMTGDGVNDAPSIKEADIGIGMGITGTEVSKGAADMVLTDDNFATIVGAVEEGRKIYSNIKKAIQFLLSANIAEVLCLFIATVFMKVTFLTPVMILWVNLVTDSLPALSLGMEKAENDVMNYPPRKSGSSLFAGKTGKDIIIQGIMQTALVMLSFCIGNYVLPDGVQNHDVAMTMGFVSLCFIQLFHSYNLRSQSQSVFNRKMFDNKYLNISFVIGAVLITGVILIRPIGNLFSTSPLTTVEWAISLAVAFAVIPLVEIQKIIEKAVEKAKAGK